MTVQTGAYEKFRDSLPGEAKRKLDELYDKRFKINQEVVRTNISTDRNRLTIVNSCINPFKYKSYVSGKTGYLFIRVEPLYNLGVKNFDVALFNNENKGLILVECKSSIFDAKKLVRDILKKVKVAEDNREKLENMIGDDISFAEYVLSSSPSETRNLKQAIIPEDAPICLWAYDIFTKKLFLEKIKENTSAEIRARRLHRDSSLRRLLLNGVQSVTGSTPMITFLPSSHSCTILTEIGSLLHFYMEKNRKDRFYFADIQTLLEREKSLLNFDPEEIADLARSVIDWGLEVEIFADKSPTMEDITQKKFELDVSRTRPRTVVRGIRHKYLRHKSMEKAKAEALETFQKRRIQGMVKLEEFMEEGN